MKPNRETENENVNLPPKFEHWFLKSCSEVSEVRRQQRHRELAQLHPGDHGYAQNGVADRR